MRAILNISLPSYLAETVKEEVKKGKYTSVSEFVRTLIRDWDKKRAIDEILEAEEDVRKGRIVRLKSLADLR